ncbi:MAG TPA: UDP-2,3-diacylglucosamine diphosphatase LpxI [Pyrinomonadaceae bacterium]|nr:UDP-2,3-diacylglucosamine diphosphatase LpxI [Pyrinomonadaceae bacterium]
MRDENAERKGQRGSIHPSSLSPHPLESPSSLIPHPLVRYGLIAGNGRFPFMVVEGARRAGVSLSVAAIREETDSEIESRVDRLTWIGVGQLGKLIRFFKAEGVEKAIMAGQVRHVQIFSKAAIPDARMLKMLLKLPRRNTDSLIGGIADELEREGIELIDSTFFLQDNLPSAGPLTRREPGAAELADINYGLEVAGQIATLDLGQTIVVRGKACVAIEAMEGTDATIRRAGELMRGQKGAAKPAVLSRGPLTVLKLSKPNQDMRFDVPVVGVPTLETMVEAGATCLCISARKTLMFDREEMIAFADKQKIAMFAV